MASHSRGVNPTKDAKVAPTLPAKLDARAEQIGLFGQSDPHWDVLSQLNRAAKTNAEVLLVGETGVGKELYARYVHESSGRAKRPFCPVNCAIQESLFESEMFGHCTGAFTGAGNGSQGFVAAAEGGTLFLDEVDQLPAVGQVKLLRFLQEKEFRRLGETRLQRADVRIVSATNRSPEDSMAEGQLREDLYYRLNVFETQIPALRDRPDDIGPLLCHFSLRYAAECGRTHPIEFTPEAKQLLLSHSWPGNVRQFENFIRRLACHHPDSPEPIGREAIANVGIPRGHESAADGVSEELLQLPFADAKRRHVDEFERRYLTNMLRVASGNVCQAAKMAGQNRRAFFRLMVKHGIDRKQFVPSQSSKEPPKRKSENNA